jgi:hypothetical protein
MKDAYKVFVGEPEGKRPFRRPRRRWEDNIRMDFCEIMWKVADQIRLAQGTDQWPILVNTVMNFLVP